MNKGGYSARVPDVAQGFDDVAANAVVGMIECVQEDIDRSDIADLSEHPSGVAHSREGGGIGERCEQPVDCPRAKADEDLRSRLGGVGAGFLGDPVNQRLDGCVIVQTTKGSRNGDLNVDVVVADMTDQDWNSSTISKATKRFRCTSAFGRVARVHSLQQAIEGVRHDRKCPPQPR